VFREQVEILGDGLLVRAPAKINLSLLIAGKRADGFHEVETIMAKVNFFDEVLIQRGRQAGLELVVTGPHWAPAGESNLAYRACKALLESCGTAANIKITLRKNVPAGAGLGSASSDAAAALLGVNRFLQLGLDKDCLNELATTLGSDVAFFLDGPLALCTGRGEKIKKLGENFGFLALLILPNVSVSTRKVYANYEHDSALYGKLSAEIEGYIQKNRIDLVCGMCANMLETSCFGLYKELAELKGEIESLGIGPVCLSGSGAGMFFIVDSEAIPKAKKYKHKLTEKVGCKSVIVSNNRW
jgi:4-diphosphocytidyl-2-C-methyl-D-erythritol kinase